MERSQESQRNTWITVERHFEKEFIPNKGFPLRVLVETRTRNEDNREQVVLVICLGNHEKLVLWPHMAEEARKLLQDAVPVLLEKRDIKRKEWESSSKFDNSSGWKQPSERTRNYRDDSDSYRRDYSEERSYKRTRTREKDF